MSVSNGLCARFFTYLYDKHQQNILSKQSTSLSNETQVDNDALEVTRE